MSDPIESFLRAGERGDARALAPTLAPDVRLHSPLAGAAVFRGRDDVTQLLGVVYRCLRGLSWREHHADGRVHVAVGEARVLGVRITDAMILTTDDDGLIAEIRPHIRPWAGLTAFGIALMPRLLCHPGLLRRSTRG